MKAFFGGVALMGLFQGCDFGAPRIVQEPDMSHLQPPTDTGSATKVEGPCEAPQLYTLSERVCTKSTWETFWNLFAWSPHIEVAPGGRKLSLRLEFNDDDPSDVPAPPALEALSFRNSETGDLLSFACELEAPRLYACTPQCRVPKDKIESTDAKDCLPIGEMSLQNNAEKKGALVIYRYRFRNLSCPEETALFGDLKVRTPSGAFGYCDEGSHERKNGNATIPSFDVSESPVSGDQP